MTTQTNPGTNSTTITRALPAPGGPTKQQAVKCSQCALLNTDELAAWADRIGWCTARGQYRVAGIERACDSFSSDGGL